MPAGEPDHGRRRQHPLPNIGQGSAGLVGETNEGGMRNVYWAMKNLKGLENSNNRFMDQMGDSGINRMS